MTTKALLLLDLQNEMVDPAGKVGAHGLARAAAERGVLNNAAKALRAARERGLLVGHIRLGFRPDYQDSLSVAPRITKLKDAGAAILGTWGCEFPAQVAPLESELVFTKQCVNPFFNTSLLTFLLRRGIAELVLVGVATNLVVEATARAAADAGFAVTVLEDCCASPNPAWHQFSVENMLPLFGTVISTAQFVGG
jgi:nicotinamidase-related amidase